MAATNDDHIHNFLRLYDIRTLADISDDLLCSICGKVMINACFGPCLCQYCEECIKNFFDESEVKQCPGQTDNCCMLLVDYDSDIKVDIRTNEKIRQLKVKCPNESSCKEMDTVTNMARHVTMCGCVMNKCPYFAVGCHFESLDTFDIERHLLTEGVHHSKILIESVINIRNQMDSWQLERPYQNEIDRLKDTVDMLQTDNCRMNMRIVELESVVDSLQREMSAMRQRFDAADDNGMTEHDGLLDQTCVQGCVPHNNEGNGAEQVAVVCDDVDDHVCRLHEYAVHESAGNTDILDRVEAISKELSEVKANTAAIGQNTENMHSGFSKELDDLDERIEHFEQNDCEEFVWKVEHLGQLRRCAVDGIGGRDYSDPFYSHRAYKMRLGIDFDDEPDIFIGFQIMQGEYDDELQWPFKGTVIISTLSQHDGTAVLTESYHYDDGKHNSKNCFTKPMDGNNNPYGTKAFLNWNKLRQFKDVYKRDCIYVRCRILR